MKSLIAFSIMVVFACTGCTKSNDPEPAVFQATINGTQWKATTMKAVLNGENSLPAGPANFWLTGYTEDGQAIYLQTNNHTVSNLNFREQLFNLEEFQVKRVVNSDMLLITWKTSSEVDTDKFEVQRSTDGLNWVRLSVINAARNSSTEKLYSYSEKQPFNKPFDGITYYRLYMLNRDGSNSYSSIATMPFGRPAIYKFSNNSNNYAGGLSGSVKVTEVNAEKRLVSGTFSFNYLNDNTGRQEKIENGKFSNIPY